MTGGIGLASPTLPRLPTRQARSKSSEIGNTKWMDGRTRGEVKKSGLPGLLVTTEWSGPCLWLAYRSVWQNLVSNPPVHLSVMEAHHGGVVLNRGCEASFLS